LKEAGVNLDWPTARELAWLIGGLVLGGVTVWAATHHRHTGERHRWWLVLAAAAVTAVALLPKSAQ